MLLQGIRVPDGQIQLKGIRVPGTPRKNWPTWAEPVGLPLKVMQLKSKITLEAAEVEFEIVEVEPIYFNFKFAVYEIRLKYEVHKNGQTFGKFPFCTEDLDLAKMICDKWEHEAWDQV